MSTRLRLLTERLMEDAKKIYATYGFDLKPKWFPVFYLLSKEKQLSITEMALSIGQSHASISKIVKEMIKKGLVQEGKDDADGRRNLISLSNEGQRIAESSVDQFKDVQAAVDIALGQCNHNIWKAINEFEYILNQKPLFNRVMEQKKNRESTKIQIVDYQAKYQQAFRVINEEWISKYFQMEKEDYKALDHPKEYILDKGGYIAIALYENEPVGVCALIKMEDPEYEYELGKMGVSPKAQGKGIAYLLGQAIIQKTKSLGANKLYLESNTKLAPAIKLYQKLGFKKITGRDSPYERCNIQMELNFED